MYAVNPHSEPNTTRYAHCSQAARSGGFEASSVHSSPAMAVGVCLNVPLACVAFEINATPEHRDRRLFCSELVCRTYELAGVPLVDRSPSFVNPAEVYRSPRLRYVGHLPVGAAAGS